VFDSCRLVSAIRYVCLISPIRYIKLRDTKLLRPLDLGAIRRTRITSLQLHIERSLFLVGERLCKNVYLTVTYPFLSDPAIIYVFLYRLHLLDGATVLATSGLIWFVSDDGTDRCCEGTFDSFERVNTLRMLLDRSYL
jgi:hypothetical protein